MSNYWNKMSPMNSLLNERVGKAHGGKIDKKPIKPKRIILWKGKSKDWPGAEKAKERTGKAKGGRIGLRDRVFAKGGKA